ncbi:hypothetical protein PILCRDRAFT_670109 [Piloderma croceum F 1598]|uniref:Uncharacterized protein n=1 Tax=Piloderma croceum (strain F 1598) TaxID=765440 RepID=A0A0C3BE57_PILCF|nr:hypothetical protein PILCRDRAFT_670109 [Piloderma croceum F 1598]
MCVFYIHRGLPCLGWTNEEGINNNNTAALLINRGRRQTSSEFVVDISALHATSEWRSHFRSWTTTRPVFRAEQYRERAAGHRADVLHGRSRYCQSGFRRDRL